MTIPTIPPKGRLPLLLLVLAEWAPRDETGNSSYKDFERIRVDKETFDRVLEELARSVTLDVSDLLSDRPADRPVTIPLSGIKSFRPEAIVEAVPAFGDLAKIRQMVVQLREGTLSDEVFRMQLGRIQSSTAVPDRIKAAILTRKLPAGPSQPLPITIKLDRPSAVDENKEEALESLLEMVEGTKTGGKATGSYRNTAESMLDHLISLITPAGRSGSGIDSKMTDQVTAELDELLSAQMDEVLHHPEFQRLEAAWRGLKFLVDRADFLEPIRVEILNIPKERLAERFEREVFQPESEGTAEAPVLVIVADYAFDRSPRDIDLLQDLARKAEILQVPFITSIGPAFLGLDSIQEVERLSALVGIFDQPEYVKWRSIRKESASRWLALLFNRFLLRIPYGPEGDRVKSFGYRESVRSDAVLLWGNPIWGMAGLLAGSFARTGWCAGISGVRGGGMIEDLPVREVRTRGSERGQSPVEHLISEAHQTDLAREGIISLAGRLNTDAAWVLSAPTVHLPERYPDAGETTASILRATLPYQMVAGRISCYVGRIAVEMGSGQSPEAIQKVFTEVLTSLLAISGEIPSDAVEVKVRESEERPDRHEVSVTFRPDRAGLGLSAPVELILLVHK